MSKIAKYSTIGAAVLHILLGFVASLQGCALRDLGFFFWVMAILSLAAIISAAMEHPLFVLAALGIILIPGFIIRVLTCVTLAFVFGSTVALAFLMYIWQMICWVIIFI